MAKHCQRPKFNVGCWNMRTLVEAEGNIASSVGRPGSRGVPVDRKVMPPPGVEKIQDECACNQ